MFLSFYMLMLFSKNIRDFCESSYGECTQNSSGNLILVRIVPLAAVSYMKHKKIITFLQNC